MRQSTFRLRLKVALSRGQPLSTGPTAETDSNTAFKDLRKMRVLLRAWQIINRNAETSGSRTTRQRARDFSLNLPANLKKIQTQLRTGYKFAPAHGATPPKGGGKAGNRPIVVAPIRDRIVQRAILDTLQSKRFPMIEQVLRTPTSIGGIPGRGVDHAIKIFAENVAEGATYVAGSDIASFFTKIDQTEIVEFLKSAGVCDSLLALTESALRVELRNADTLPDELLSLFPIGTDGVAQGSPLSALAGNIVLRDFDRRLNGRGVSCIRYIDDFIICGRKSDHVKKAMNVAKSILSDKGMGIYDPLANPKKAFAGAIGKPHVFLGYELIPGRFPPATSSCDKLLTNISSELANGRATIAKAVTGKYAKSADRAFVQTLVQVDRIIRGWRDSHKMAVCPDLYIKLDVEIDRRLSSFSKFYREKTANCTPQKRRNALGVSPLWYDHSNE